MALAGRRMYTCLFVNGPWGCYLTPRTSVYRTQAHTTLHSFRLVASSLDPGEKRTENGKKGQKMAWLFSIGTKQSIMERHKR